MDNKTDAAKPGVLYGVGVGPGDPELLTLKAAQVIGEADMLFAAVAQSTPDSTALDIARPHMRAHDGKQTKAHLLRFPVTADPEEIDRAWTRHAARLARFLRAGRTCAFLTLGDPLLYSTFIYLARAVRRLCPEADIRAVPGVGAAQAAAARGLTVLARPGESLALVPAFRSAEALSAALAVAGNAVALKAYRSYPALRESLRTSGLLDRAVVASNLGREGEAVSRDLDATGDRPPYFTLIAVGHPLRQGLWPEESPAKP